jgi:hypothetical protein
LQQPQPRRHRGIRPDDRWRGEEGRRVGRQDHHQARPIKKLDTDMGMMMVFRAKDPAMLKQVKPGDKIKFEADKVSGQLAVLKIEKQEK